MANIQIDISENGTKTLATAGKYCDRNIDVNVNVPSKATQFTNVLEYAEFEINKRYGSSGAYNSSSPNQAIAVTLDLNKLPNGITLKKNTNDIRYRGCLKVDSSFAQSNDNITYSAKGLSGEVKYVDEYGDAVFQRGYIDKRYVRFNIGINTLSSSNTALADDFDPVAFGCIVTFNEPIGNGGHAG